MNKTFNLFTWIVWQDNGEFATCWVLCGFAASPQWLQSWATSLTSMPVMAGSYVYPSVRKLCHEKFAIPLLGYHCSAISLFAQVSTPLSSGLASSNAKGFPGGVALTVYIRCVVPLVDHRILTPGWRRHKGAHALALADSNAQVSSGLKLRYKPFQTRNYLP